MGEVLEAAVTAVWGDGRRFYGTNGHHDVTWLASDAGGVTSTLRYDPWGNVAATSGSYLPAFRFHGSWFDATVGLSWVVNRWYAPSLGRFVSEDPQLGDISQPATRHPFGYAIGDPIQRIDPLGLYVTEGGGSGTGQPAFFSKRIDNVDGMVGKIKISMFIPTLKICMPVTLADCGWGDYRSWSRNVETPAGVDCERTASATSSPDGGMPMTMYDVPSVARALRFCRVGPTMGSSSRFCHARGRIGTSRARARARVPNVPTWISAGGAAMNAGRDREAD